MVLLGVFAVWFGYEALRPVAARVPSLAAAAVFAAPLSFFVYASQQPQLKAVMLVLRDHVTGLPQLVDYLLAPVLTIGCSLLVAVTWRRLSPATFSLVSGGRAARGRGVTGAASADGRTADEGAERVPAPAGAGTAESPAVLAGGSGPAGAGAPEGHAAGAPKVGAGVAPRAVPGAARRH